MNRHVCKGEKGIKILAPLVQKVEQDNNEKVLILKGFRTVSVFDVSQTKGEDLPSIVQPLSGEDNGLIKRLIKFLEKIST